MTAHEPIRVRAGSPIRAALRVPLFAKLLFANSAIAIVAVAAGDWLARRGGIPGGPFAEPGFFIAALLAVAGTIAVNAVIVMVALRPMRLLERAAAEVAAGRVGVRAPVSAFADHEFAGVVRTFNAALDAAEASRVRLQAVAARTMSSTEEQRRRISFELHEGVAQTLANARIRVQLARGARDADLQADQLEGLSAELEEAIEKLRGIAGDLRPLTLDMLGLGAAVRAFATSVGEAAGIDVTVRTDTGAWEITDAAELGVYRILQDAIANVVQHAGAKHLDVGLRVTPYGSLHLAVEDDGRGFDMAERLASPDSLGLAGMQERAGYLGGRLEIRSEPGRGTRVTAEIPVTQDGAVAAAGATKAS